MGFILVTKIIIVNGMGSHRVHTKVIFVNDMGSHRVHTKIIIVNDMGSHTVKVKQSHYRPGQAKRVPES